MPLKIGARPSRLAFVQAQEAIYILRGMGIHALMEVVCIASDGDEDKTTPISRVEGQDFFTGRLEKALLAGDIDLAVHSAKDLEDRPPEGLMLMLTESISPHECLVARAKWDFETLPVGSRIGTSSQKRADAVRRYRTDIVVKDIRGTIEERLRQLDEGHYDALIVAEAALVRLGLTRRITQIIPADIIAPHPLQGRLAIQCRCGDQRFEKYWEQYSTMSV